MSYIETLEPEMSEEEVSVREGFEHCNRDFLKSLFATYPALKPEGFTLGLEPINPRLIEGVKDRLDPLHLAKLEARRERRLEARQTYKRIVSRHSPTSRKIIKQVADWFELEPSDLTSQSRLAYVVSARFVAMRLLFDIKKSNGQRKFSYPMIGAFFGGRDHSSILHAVKTFDDRSRAYPEMQEAYEALREG